MASNSMTADAWNIGAGTAGHKLMQLYQKWIYRASDLVLEDSTNFLLLCFFLGKTY